MLTFVVMNGNKVVHAGPDVDFNYIFPKEDKIATVQLWQFGCMIDSAIVASNTGSIRETFRDLSAGY